MQVAVIGCGPAGLAAVHAARGLGADVVIFSPGVKSPQRGPLVLQRPIPGITTDHPDGYIRQIVIGGSILDYRYKLYGDINIGINGDILQEGYHCWKHIEAYDLMWNRYMTGADLHTIRRTELVTPSQLKYMHEQFALVVNTAPLNNLCTSTLHQFKFKAVEITMGTSYPDQPEDTTIFNAGNDYPWVRSAWLLGNSCTEWLVGSAPQEQQPFTIRKPIRHNCTCYPHVLGTGRFGAWKNQVWVDTAYYEVREAILSMQRQPVWDRVL